MPRPPSTARASPSRSSGLGQGRDLRPLRGVVRASVGGAFVGGRIGRVAAGTESCDFRCGCAGPARYANRGTPDQAQRLQVRGIDLLGSVTSALQVEVIETGGLRHEWSGRVRAFIRRSVDAAVGTHDARSGRRRHRRADRRSRRAGSRHHRAAAAGRRLPRHSHLRRQHRGADRGPCSCCCALPGRAGGTPSLLAILCLLVYAQVVAPEASVTRAVFAAAVFLAARAADHRTEPLNTLALAAGCLVAADPRSLVDPGFQLTFGGHGRTPGRGARGSCGGSTGAKRRRGPVAPPTAHLARLPSGFCWCPPPACSWRRSARSWRSSRSARCTSRGSPWRASD